MRGLAHHLAETNLRPLELALARLDLGEIENIVDELEQMAPAVVDVANVGAVARGRDGAVDPAHDEIRKPHDGVERRSEIVAHRRQEFALRAVGVFRLLSCALGSAVRLREIGRETLVGEPQTDALGGIRMNAPAERAHDEPVTAEIDRTEPAHGAGRHGRVQHEERNVDQRANERHREHGPVDRRRGGQARAEKARDIGVVRHILRGPDDEDHRRPEEIERHQRAEAGNGPADGLFRLCFALEKSYHDRVAESGGDENSGDPCECGRWIGPLDIAEGQHHGHRRNEDRRELSVSADNAQKLETHLSVELVRGNHQIPGAADNRFITMGEHSRIGLCGD
jgi:hypothetical protein